MVYIHIYIYIYMCINIYIYIYMWTLVGIGVGICLQKAPYLYEIVCALKVYSRPLLHSFQRYYNLSKGMHEVRPHFLKGISPSLKNKTWDHRYWKIVCKKKTNPCPKCTLSALFCFNCCGIVFEQCQILQKISWK